VNLQGLTTGSLAVFEQLKKSELFQEYILIGGTALSIQINSRLSEDLDFCKWHSNPKTLNKSVNWPILETYLKTIGEVKTDIIDLHQVNFILNNVKITFYSNPITSFREIETKIAFNNISVATVSSIGGMKLEVMSRRNIFRDYYDLYSILKEGVSLKEIVLKCGRLSFHRMNTKGILGIISNGTNFRKEENFSLLKPKYDVDSSDIQDYIRELIQKEFGVVKK
jgi:hypothetical protein